MLINEYYWLLEFLNGDFILVHPPSLEISRELRAYHSILLAKFKHKAGDGFHNKLFDDPLFVSFKREYMKIVGRLSPAFDPQELTRESRHSFFIAAEKRGDYWLSGLEILMGLDYEKPEDKATSKLNLTSGDSEIDIVAGLLLQENISNLEWLVRNHSPQYLVKLLTQINNCRRGQDALDDLQREQDLTTVKQKNIDEKLAAVGFNF